ncbi:MAG: hypothetical protein BWX48_01688 [Verrucomicrobia bacterium ADurb.Bin006]|nr:MAG: hypothetical protein BWX48_01688 [Verrucomicrobia bacterium ADurb.Bin006]
MPPIETEGAAHAAPKLVVVAGTVLAGRTERRPSEQSVRVALVRDRIARSVAAPERRGAPERFEVDPASAAGAIVDHQPGAAGQQAVPERVEALDVSDFAHPLPVGRVRFLPKRQRVHVEILPITAQPEFVHLAQNEIGEKLPGLRNPEVKQQVVAAHIQKPVTPLRVPGRSLEHPLRLEPQHEFAPIFSQRVAQRLESVRIEIAFHLPAADVDRPAAGAVPLGIDPVVRHGQIVPDYLGDVVEMDLGARAAPVARGDGGHERLAVKVRTVVRQHELAPEILPAPPVSRVKDQRQARRANLLARTQPQTGLRQAGTHGNLAAHAAHEVRGPFTAPPDRRHHAPVRSLDIEERHHLA